jgi:uncharacterized protein with HEPN domain
MQDTDPANPVSSKFITQITNEYNTLKKEADEFEAYMSSNKLDVDKSYCAAVTMQLQYISGGISRYPKAIKDRHPYIKEDNRAMKDMLKDVKEQLNKRKQKYYT